MRVKLKITKIIHIFFALCFLIFAASCGTAGASGDDSLDGENARARNRFNEGEAAQGDINGETEAEPEAEPEDGNAGITDEAAESENKGRDDESEFYLPVYEINPKFLDLLKINGEIVGEIKIPGTLIDFPVVYNGDNDYYLKRDIYGNETKYGAVFMDQANHGAVLDGNTIIHGHNFNEPKRGIYDDSIFADLEKFKDKEFFDANKTIIFNNLYSDMEWEVFSVYVTSEADYYLYAQFDSEQAYIDFAEFLKSRSMFESDYQPQAGDYMLTLHTCSYEFNGAHTVVHARLVSKTDYFR